jgi:hypothetical protein
LIAPASRLRQRCDDVLQTHFADVFEECRLNHLDQMLDWHSKFVQQGPAATFLKELYEITEREATRAQALPVSLPAPQNPMRQASKKSTRSATTSRLPLTIAAVAARRVGGRISGFAPTYLNSETSWSSRSP